jgi:hypothetical protein
MDQRQDLDRLSEPFPSAQVNWKPQTISRDGSRALAVAYIDARDVAERLDAVVGPANWAVDHKDVGGQTLTGISVRHPETGEWVWKWDAGLVGREGDEAMSVKGSLSDGLKRAAVLWGVGRYLYRLPKTWVGYDSQKKRLTETPALPRWALPAGEAPSTTGINRPSGETHGVSRADVARKAA